MEKIAVSAGAVAVFGESVAGVVNARVGGGLLLGNLVGAGFAGVLVQYHERAGGLSARNIGTVLGTPFLIGSLLLLVGIGVGIAGSWTWGVPACVAGVSAGYVVAKHLLFVEGHVTGFVAAEVVGAVFFSALFAASWVTREPALLYVAATLAMLPVFVLGLRQVPFTTLMSPVGVPKQWAVFGLWVAVATALGNSLGTLPVVILVSGGEPGAAGVVAGVMGWLAPLLLLPRAFSLVMVPRIARSWTRRDLIAIRRFAAQQAPMLEALAFSALSLVWLGAWLPIGYLSLSREPVGEEPLVVLVAVLIVGLQAAATPLANVLAGCERARENALATVVSFGWLGLIPLLGMSALTAVVALAAATATRYVLLYMFSAGLVGRGDAMAGLLLLPFVMGSLVSGEIQPPIGGAVLLVFTVVRRRWLVGEVKSLLRKGR